MAKLIQPRSEKEIRHLGVANVRQAYIDLAKDYERIINNDVLLCPVCNRWLSTIAFYNDKRFATGLFYKCKECCLAEATDYDKKEKVYVDNREKTIEMFRQMDLPFIDSLYKSAIKTTTEALGEKNRSTAYQHMLVMVKSLEQYNKLHFDSSDFGDETFDEEQNVTSRKPRKEIQKLFGSGFTNEEYLYLQDQYDDWCSRTQVDTKSQQTYVVQICFTLLDIYKDRKDGRDVTKKLEALDRLMNAANLQPKQNVSNAATDNLTFGQLIEKWEEEAPIPDPDPEFADVDSIGKYIRVWFAGWLSHALGLKNAYSKEYLEYIDQYKVNKPEYSEDGSSSQIYDQLFGNANGE